MLRSLTLSLALLAVLLPATADAGVIFSETRLNASGDIQVVLSNTTGERIALGIHTQVTYADGTRLEVVREVTAYPGENNQDSGTNEHGYVTAGGRTVESRATAVSITVKIPGERDQVLRR